jgi:glutathione S-transferase
MHFAEGSAMLPLLLAGYVGFLGDAGAPLRPRIDSEIANYLGYLEKEIGSKNFMVGNELTGADIQLSFVLEAASARRGLQSYPNLARYIASLQARPAYKRALDKGGPYELMR